MKIIVTKLNQSAKRGTAAKTKRVRDDQGRLVTIRSVDAGSRTFGSDLRGVFAKNVSQARKDNKAVADRGRRSR